MSSIPDPRPRPHGAASFPFQPGDTVRLAIDPAHRDAVVEVRDNQAELGNGCHYPADELVADPVPDERWLPLQGHEAGYLISNHGKILSLNYHRTGRVRLLKLTNRHTSPKYTLPKEVGGGQPAGHLVARHFPHSKTGAEQPGDHIGFRDGNRGNLRWDNLFWYDRRQLRELGLLEYMNKTGHLTKEAAAVAAAALRQGLLHAEVAAAFGVSGQTVKMLARREGITRKRRLTAHEQAAMLARLDAGEPPGALAAEYGVHRVTVHRLRPDLVGHRPIGRPPAAGRKQ